MHSPMSAWSLQPTTVSTLSATNTWHVRGKNHGVLVISEYTGAAEALSGGALVVNPFDADEFSSVIHQALSMGQEERKEKYEASIKYIDEHTRCEIFPKPQCLARGEINYHGTWFANMTNCYSFDWGRKFLKALKEGPRESAKSA
jgi:hypothetical protein